MTKYWTTERLPQHMQVMRAAATCKTLRPRTLLQHTTPATVSGSPVIPAILQTM